MPSSTTLVARHLLSHPDDSAYAVAQHVGIAARTAQLARNRIPHEPTPTQAYVKQCRRDPIRHRELHFRLESVERWLARPPAPVSFSGEDAAAIEGLPIVPHRHLLYLAEEDLRLVEQSLVASGAQPTSREEANVTLRVRDPWLVDDPQALVERGQRILDYLESRNPVLRASVSLGA